MLGLGEPQLHHGDQAMAASERAGVIAQIGQHSHGLGDRFWAMIGKSAWYHGISPAASLEHRSAQITDRRVGPN